MEAILEKYGAYTNGLFLLNLPTGFGKTYEVLQYILRHYDDGRPIFFITNLKKNLPHEELRQRMSDGGHLEAYDRKVLFIDATAQPLLENIGTLQDLPQEVTRWEEYKLLKKKARFVNRHRPDQAVWSDEKAEAARIIEEQIRTELEPKFRSRLIQYIERESGALSGYVSPGKKLQWIETNARWIIALYPSVMTLKKRIFFMSVDKFFARNVTLIEPSYYFHEHDLTKQAIVFLDEFDASKERLLDGIIRNGLDKRIDLVALFQQVYTTFQTLRFPAGLTRESEERLKAMQRHPGIRPITEIIDHLRNESVKLTDEFHLDVPFKTVNPDNQRNFIFHDFQYRSILKEGFQFIRLEYDGKQQVNHILFEAAQSDGSGVSLLRLLARLRAYMQYFAKGVWMIAMNYRSLKEEDGSKGFPLESALHSVLDLFNLQGKQVHYLLDTIANHLGKSEAQTDDGLPRSNYLREHSFYMNGFRYYDFEDGDNHDLTSRIFLCSFEVTPEKHLLKLAQRANVIGISATATIPTPTGNYDLDFLQQRLGEGFRTIDGDEFQRLSGHFQSLTRGYDQLNLHPQLVQCEASEQAVAELFGDLEFARTVLNTLRSEYDQEFFIRRYLRAAVAFKQFIADEGVQSFLYLGNAKATSQFAFKIDFLQHLFDKLLENHPKAVWRGNNGQPFFLIYSDQFDRKKEQLMGLLKEGKNVFVISTYQSIGAGQNLQYPVPEGAEVVQVNERTYSTSLKDFDGMYCERPTHLLVNKNNHQGLLPEADMVKNIFQMEFLAESGIISNKRALAEIRKGFELVSGRKPLMTYSDFNEESLYKSPGFAQHISKVVIQAIGRMSRTNLKNRDIHIMAHHSLSRLLQKAHGSQQIYLREYEALLERCETPVNDLSTTEQQHYHRADRKNKKCTKLIDSLVNNDFREQNHEFWQQLREFVLKHPRIARLSDIPTHFRPFYFKLPDGAETYVFHHNPLNREDTYSSTNQPHTGVCASDCRLSKLMTHTDIRAHFEAQGYATEFGSGRYILTPTGYTNIYKGMLGETTGKFLLETYTHLELLPLEAEELEQFDFKTSDGTYIDFKHWFAHNLADGDWEGEKILQKMNRTGAEQALIINLFSEGAYQPLREGNVLEIPRLIEVESNRVDVGMIQEILRFVG